MRICLVLEGCYPYVHGGVSTWMHSYIEAMKEHEFVLWVIGANDVTNPAARKPGTPVSGMPILDVDKAQNVVVMKRGRGTGYAGIQNELYFEDNTQMLFGDAKASLQAVIAAVKELIN